MTMTAYRHMVSDDRGGAALGRDNDVSRRTLYATAGAAALLTAVMIPIQIAVFVASPFPETVAGRAPCGRASAGRASPQPPGANARRLPREPTAGRCGSRPGDRLRSGHARARPRSRAVVLLAEWLAEVRDAPKHGYARLPTTATFASSGARMNDDHRYRTVEDALLAHRTQQQSCEAAVASASDNEWTGVASGFLQESMHGCTRRRPAVDGHVGSCYFFGD